jgi:hypothetical protein
MAPANIERIEIRAETRPAPDAGIGWAVQKFQKVAESTKTHRVLGARIGQGHYTPALQEQVPYGVACGIAG